MSLKMLGLDFNSAEDAVSKFSDPKIMRSVLEFAAEIYDTFDDQQLIAAAESMTQTMSTDFLNKKIAALPADNVLKSMGLNFTPGTYIVILINPIFRTDKGVLKPYLVYEVGNFTKPKLACDLVDFKNLMNWLYSPEQTKKIGK